MSFQSGARIVGLVLALGVGRAAADDRTALDALVRDALRSWGVPGVAVAVVRGDDVVYLEGRGVREAGTAAPMTPDTLFPLASCTKAFTTSAMAILVDTGAMSWDDPVRKHLPTFHLSDPHADADVRLRDLVSHRTGVRSHDLLWYRAPWSQEEQIRRIGLMPLDRPFRTTFQYQSTMFVAAGHAVAAAAGEPWHAFVRRRLIDPLGMKSVVFTSADAARSTDRALPHKRTRDGRLDVVPFYPLDVPDPAGSLHASARDLTRWLRFHLGEGTIDGKRLVAAAALRETHTPQIALRLEGTARALNPETHLLSYGMGWLVRDHRGRHIVEHAGLIDGFRAHVAFAPKEKYAVAILCNLHETRMTLALSNALLDHLFGLPRKDWNALLQAAAQGDAKGKTPKGERKPSLPLVGYSGVYEEPAYGTARVAVEGGRLVLRWSSFAVPLEPIDGETFVADHEHLGYAEVTFAVEGGRAKGMNVGEPLGVTFRRR